uniref:Sof1-like protein domain-containing protein n=1 Tax=Panagrolaimus sp. PS1159 TaxID=55785 RepID=A0AC35GLQ0_9BILA
MESNRSFSFIAASDDYSVYIVDMRNLKRFIGTIIKHRQVPKAIFHTAKELKIIYDKKKRKEGNLRTYAKPGTL